MLLVHTQLRQSLIHGIGLFAEQVIEKDTVVWEFNPNIDLLFSHNNYQLTSAFKLFMNQYAFLDKTGWWIVCGDNARFMNHSTKPSLGHVEGVLGGQDIAAGKIMPGDELTCDYRLFDMAVNTKLNLKELII